MQWLEGQDPVPVLNTPFTAFGTEKTNGAFNQVGVLRYLNLNGGSSAQVNLSLPCKQLGRFCISY